MKTSARSFPTLLLGAALLLATAGCDGSADDEPARLRLVHAAPATGAIDFFIDFDLFARDVAFGEASPYTEWRAGLRLLEARATQGAPVSISREVLLEAGLAYTFVVADAVGSAPIALLQDDRTAPGAGQARLRVVHAAPRAQALSVVAVPDAGGPPVLDVASLGYGQATTQANVAVGTYELTVAATDGGGAESSTLTLEVGRRYLVVVAHRGSTRALSLFTVVDG